MAYDAGMIVCCWMGCDETAGGSCLPRGFTGGAAPAEFAKAIFQSAEGSAAIPLPRGVTEVELDGEALTQRCEVRLAWPWTEPKLRRCRKGTSPPTEDFSFERGNGLSPAGKRRGVHFILKKCANIIKTRKAAEVKPGRSARLGQMSIKCKKTTPFIKNGVALWRQKRIFPRSALALFQKTVALYRSRHYRYDGCILS